MNKKKRKEVIKKNNEKEIINSYWRLFKDLKAKITFWDKLKHFLALEEKIDKKYWLIKGDFDAWLCAVNPSVWLYKQKWDNLDLLSQKKKNIHLCKGKEKRNKLVKSYQ